MKADGHSKEQCISLETNGSEGTHSFIIIVVHDQFKKMQNSQSFIYEETEINR